MGNISVHRRTLQTTESLARAKEVMFKEVTFNLRTESTTSSTKEKASQAGGRKALLISDKEDCVPET